MNLWQNWETKAKLDLIFIAYILYNQNWMLYVHQI